MTELQTREENAMLTEGNNRWYLVGGLVAAAAVGYWLWQRSKKDDEAGTDTTGGGADDTPDNGDDTPDNGGGATPGVPQALPGLIPESAWNTVSAGQDTFSVIPGKTYAASILIPAWATPDDQSHKMAQDASLGLEVVDVQDMGGDIVRVRMHLKPLESGSVYLSPVEGGGLLNWSPVAGEPPVVRRLILKEIVSA